MVARNISVVALILFFCGSFRFLGLFWLPASPIRQTGQPTEAENIGK